MNYVFYFDESFHDRKITISDGGDFNITKDNSLDNYIGVFWGCKSNFLHKNIALIKEFKTTQKERFLFDESKELKSTMINKKQFKDGLQSFNRNTYLFYKDFFMMLDNINPIIQVNIYSKMEFFLRTSFKGIKFPPENDISDHNFFYTLTKFFIFYNNEDLNKSLVEAYKTNNPNILKKQLLNTLDTIIKATYGIPRKKRESLAFISLRKLLNDSEFNIQIDQKIDFRYFPNFDGLVNLLNEINIDPNKIKLVIDKEENTHAEGKKFPFRYIKQVDSRNVIQILISDILSGFLGRMMYALSNDKGIKEDEIRKIEDIYNNDLETRRILSEKWFVVNEDIFQLYSLIHKVLIVNNQNYWKTLTLSYADVVIYFFSLLRHFASYTSYDDFKIVTPTEHSEIFNNRCLHDMTKSFDN